MSRFKNFIPHFVILMIAFLIFLPSVGNSFAWDDIRNFIDNTRWQGFSGANIAWMFSTISCDNYFPLTWLSMALDYEIWGLNPAGYHFTNVIIHSINAVIFFLLIKRILSTVFIYKYHLRQMNIGAFVAAILFSLHPLRVETVAWVSTRADLLCAFFYMLAVFSYLDMKHYRSTVYFRPNVLLTFCLFVPALLCRAWAVTLPAILLTLDIYPLKRIDIHLRPMRSLSAILLEKLPFFILSLAVSVLAFIGKRSDMQSITSYGLLDRTAQAFYGLGFYVYKTILPLNLSPLYLMEGGTAVWSALGISLISAGLAITVLAIVSAYRMPWLATIWFSYVIILSPVLGFFQSGLQIVADRYTYIATIPLFIIAGAGIAWLGVTRDMSGKYRNLWNTTIVLAVATAVLYAGLSIAQLQIWRNCGTLWSHVIKIQPHNFVAYYNRGNYSLSLGDTDGAIRDYGKTIEIFPRYGQAYFNRGKIFIERGSPEKAISDFNYALSINSNSTEAYSNRAKAFKLLGRSSESESDLDAVIRLNPKDYDAWLDRATLKRERNNLVAAVEDYSESIRLDPARIDAYVNRGGTYLMMDDALRAATDFGLVVRLSPDSPLGYYGQGLFQEKVGNDAEARKLFDRALELAVKSGNSELRDELRRKLAR